MARKQPEPEAPQHVAPRSMDMVRRPAGAASAPQMRPVAPPPRPVAPQPLPLLTQHPVTPLPPAQRPVVVPSPQPQLLARPAGQPIAVARSPRRFGRLLLHIFAWLLIIVAIAAAVIELYIHYYQ